MKKAIKVNLGGLVFHIDEDAYILLQEYIDTVKNHFKTQAGGAEIIEDIETRIAELFQERINPGKESVTAEDVNEVIKILGRPNEFSDDDEQSQASNDNQYTERNLYSTRRLYRDVEQGYLGGVASGIGAYFNVELVYIRLVFFILIFFYGTGLLLYLVFWLAVPPARTTAQKLEMRGENINLDNIEKAINKEYQQVKKNFQNYRSSRAYQDVRNGFGQFFSFIGRFIAGVFKAVALILGIILIIGGSLSLLALGGFTFLEFNWMSWFTDIQFISVRDYIQFITASSDVQLILISLFLAVAIPVFALIYGGIKMVFRIRANDKAFGLALLVLWILSVSLAVSLVFFEAQDFRRYGSYKEETTLPMPGVQTVYIEANSSFQEPTRVMYWDFLTWSRDFGYIRKEDSWTVYGKPDFKVEASADSFYHIVVKKESMGIDNDKAIENANYITYEWNLSDSIIKIDPYYVIEAPGKWRDPDLDIVLMVPVGKSVYLDSAIRSLIGYIPNGSHKYHDRMAGYFWIMTEEGLITRDDFNNRNK